MLYRFLVPLNTSECAFWEWGQRKGKQLSMNEWTECIIYSAESVWWTLSSLVWGAKVKRRNQFDFSGRLQSKVDSWREWRSFNQQFILASPSMDQCGQYFLLHADKGVDALVRDSSKLGQIQSPCSTQIMFWRANRSHHHSNRSFVIRL